METQKILRSSDKTVIVADYREREVSDILRNLDALVNPMNLSMGDFICSERVAVERKTHSDFIASIIDGRLFDQSKNLLENFEKVVIIVEGSSDRQVNENAYRAALAKVLTDGVSIVSTKSPMETAKTIYWIANKEQSDKNSSPIFKTGKKPEDEKKLKQEIIASLPGVSKVLSQRLLENFGTIEKVFSASEEELLLIKGLRKSTAKKIKRVLSEKW